MSAPLYFFQQRLDGLYAIYDERGPVLGYEHIETAGDAASHVRDLTEAAQADDAAQDDFDAAADAMAFSLSASISEAA